jgi:hypothetical protein
MKGQYVMAQKIITSKEDHTSSPDLVPSAQGVTKRCFLSLLTNSALVYESQCVGMGKVAGSQPMSTAVHIT